MGWKSVELQIEALIPGILILGEAHVLAISWFTFRATTAPLMPSSEFAKAALFVAAAYSLGVVSSLVSRLVVDSISERAPRALIFGACAHHELGQATEDARQNDARFNQDYQREIEQRLWSTAAKWNAVYRSALRRTTRRDEVDRRRSQGRLLRNLLIPAIGAPLVFFRSPLSILAVIAAVPAFVFLYAYAEYVNFAEAYDISEAKRK